YYLLILDDYKSHYSADFERYYKENKIIMLYIPAYISYLLQPLNIDYYALYTGLYILFTPAS
ncbi:hypothetical protein FOC1_g10000016, partial [Fusarium oxysporum f. sp. cubense race 1]